jgi:transposase InsO family protein
VVEWKKQGHYTVELFGEKDTAILLQSIETASVPSAAIIGRLIARLCHRPLRQRGGGAYRLHPSNRNAKAALEKTVTRFGNTITVVNDNSSENMKDAEGYRASLGITQYRTKPKSLKEKPFVERFIGMFQRECLDYHYEPMNMGEMPEVMDSWLDKYHFYRPHEALNFLTPAEFSATVGLSIPTTGVS